MTLRELLEANLISETVAELIFTSDPDTQKRMLFPRAYVRTAQKICRFYASLVEAYVIGRAIHADKTVDELGYPDKLTDAIKRIWALDGKYSLADMTVFSFLNDCAAAEIPELTTPDASALLRSVREQCGDYANPHLRKRDHMGEDTLKRLIESLPLLASTTVNRQELKFVFAAGFESKCLPYVSFWNEETNSAVEHFTNSCCTLASVRKGERNGELLFGIAELNGSGISAEVRTIRRQASQNENLRMICKAVGLETDWYSVDECWCDLAFLNRLTTVTSSALSRFWEASSKRLHHKPGKNITEKLKDMFYGSEVRDRISSEREITIEHIDNIFFELYINCGVFKTMSALFLDTKEHEYSEELFHIYLSEFVAQGILTAEASAKYADECNRKIDSRLQKLTEIVSVKSRQYDFRSRAIKSEWRAYAVLQAAGIRSKNLFTDEEAILSIDNYYDMIKNTGSTLAQDLHSVLTMLTELYGALLENNVPFDECAFSESLRRIRRENRDADLRQLCEKLIQTAEKSAGNEVIEQLLGRSAICSPSGLEYFLNGILGELEEDYSSEETRYLSRKKIFISYSHADSAKIAPYIQMWREKGYQCVFDNERFQLGANWRAVAKTEIGGEDCAAVAVFMSRSSAVSRAVSFELEYATKVAKQRFPNDQERQDEFIIAINLENTPIKDYLSELVCADAHDPSYDPEKSMIAGQIREYITEYKIHLESGEKKNERLARINARLHELLFPTDDGELVEESRSYNALELAVANFYAFLKFGDDFVGISESEALDKFFKQSNPNISRCIFPLVASVKETQIKRDNIALVGYEIIRGKGEAERGTNYILSSRRLDPDDFYCIPNYRTMGSDCSWMVEPLLISRTLLEGE